MAASIRIHHVSRPRLTSAETFGCVQRARFEKAAVTGLESRAIQHMVQNHEEVDIKVVQ